MSDRCPWKDLPKYFDHAGAVEKIRREPGWSNKTHVLVECSVCATFFLAWEHHGWHVVPRTDLALWEYERAQEAA
jgi:hypothetical protein